MKFEEFFQALWGKDPFPWQKRLSAKVLSEGWPTSIGLPTAAGKTALLDIAVHALATNPERSARRIFFVVDRRVIVDEALERAMTIAERLAKAPADSPLRALADALRKIGSCDEPLTVNRLRGGVERSETWADSPTQPVLVCSTVDQIGSSLLFQAYGRSNYQWPIRAALAANDSLIVLDEAHTSQPFAETLEAIRRFHGKSALTEPIGRAMRVVEMSATPRGGGDVFHEDEADKADEELNLRWTASKRVRSLELVEDDAKFVKAMFEAAKSMKDAKVIGVICNRVRTAREVFAELAKVEGTSAILFIGRARPFDRDRLWREHRRWIEAGRTEDPEVPIFVVATQCIEVGANISFDALVTEIASVDALEQRLGRLDRLGRKRISNVVIVARKEQIKANAEDAVYGTALPPTWKWLLERTPKAGKKKKGAETFLDLGALELRQALQELDADARAAMTKPRESAPILLPAHLDLLCQTSPKPAAVPDAALYLHGPKSGPADVEVVWRADLRADLNVEKKSDEWLDRVAICPPASAEALAVPVWEVRRWLAGRSGGDLADIEGQSPIERKTDEPTKPFVIWRGEEDSEVSPELRPGDRIVVPATYGGCDRWGWNPASKSAVVDIGDQVKAQAGRFILRLGAHSDLPKDLAKCESGSEAIEILKTSALPDWLVKMVEKVRSPKLVTDEDGRLLALVGRGSFSQGSRSSQYTVQVKLCAHLKGVEEWAKLFSSGLPEGLRETVLAAARWHDIGKADPRFQAWLAGGVLRTTPLLAKSGGNGNNRAAVESARKKARYPKGGRHELLSVAMLEGGGARPGIDFELLLHLVASHHGRCRPFAPVVTDDEGPSVSFNGWTASANHGLWRAASGIADRFWKLNDRFGWYGLAYLEAVLRLADARRSEQEQKEAENE